MLKYLIILLDDSSVSYCHYNNRKRSNLMPLDVLQDGVLFAMKNDLKIQYLLPKEDLPQDYIHVMAGMCHDNIGILGQEDVSSVVVVNGFNELANNLNSLNSSCKYLIRIGMHEFIDNFNDIKVIYKNQISANIVFTDVENFSDVNILSYQAILEGLSEVLASEVISNHPVNTNLITDRIVLDSMNNCGAGENCVTLAPNGKFYPCPAFYYDNDVETELGSILEGINDHRRRLYFYNRAPLCKRCDAYQCKRCVWLNKRLTYEVNIPSRQQCVISHIERNASCQFLNKLHQNGILLEREILPTDYLDPFDNFKDT